MSRYTFCVQVILVPRSERSHFWAVISDESKYPWWESEVWRETKTVCGRDGPPQHGRNGERGVMDRQQCGACRRLMLHALDGCPPELRPQFGLQARGAGNER